MKKRYLLITLLISILTILNVNALEVGDTVGHHTYFDTGITTGRGSSGGVSYFRHKISETNEDIVCIIPGAGSPNNVLKVKKIYNLNNKNLASFAAGYESIMSNISSNEDYVAATLAARAFIYMYYVNRVEPSFNMSYQGGTMDQYIVAVYYYRTWFNNYKDEIKKALGKTTVTKGNASLYWGTIASRDYISKAKSRFKKALTAASNARANYSTNGITIGKASTTFNEDKSIATSITKIELNNVKEDVYLTYSCDNCTGNVFYTNNVEISTNNKKTWKTLTYEEGKGRKIGKGSITVYIRTTFKKQNSYDCSPISYTMNIKGYEGAENVALLEYSDGTSSRGNQYFIGLLKDSTGKGKTLASKKQPNINFCKECEDYQSACNTSGPGSSACTEFNEKFGGKCSECTTLVNNVECSAETSTVKIVEGVGISEDSCTLVDSNKNVKECILNNNDIAGYSYQATTEGYPNNNYCKVYCTEDYDIEVPGVQSTNSGRYIKLNANIKGTKSCYTTEINREQFEKDLEEARTEVIEAYNVWIRLDTIIKTGWSNVHNISQTYGTSCHTEHYTYPCNCTTIDGKTSCSTCSGSYCATDSTAECSTTSGNRTNTYIDGYGKTQSFNLSFGYVSATGCCGGGPRCTAVSHTTDYNRQNFPSQRTSAANVLDAAIKKYNNIIKEYNSCGLTTSQDARLKSSASSVWNMKYNFNPKVSFWYEDSHMSLAKSLYLIGTPAVGALSINNCAGEVDAYYGTCTTGWTTSTLSRETISDNKAYTCYKSGSGYTCGIVPIVVNIAKYVKQSQTSNANYILPTQFYTVYPTGKVINESKEGTSPLENALPISLGTQAGVYNYTLSIEDLGEYYNSDKTGRIWGSENSVVVTALEDENSCSYQLSTSNLPDNNPAVTGNDNGKYTCAYKVNCPSCNVTCGPDGCIWTDCEDGHCVVKCDRCIFGNGEVNFAYRPITTKDINPNNRELGANWKFDESSINTTTELKAYATTNDIITKGEKVYEEGSDDIVMKVKLTQTMIRDIKNYNDKYDDNGGYASNSLKCYNYKDSDGVIYENIYCYSTFIDEMAEKYSNNVAFTKDRVMASSASDNDSKRKKLESKNQCESGTNCYWMSWTDALNDSNFRVTTKIEKIDYTKFVNNYTDGSGPSYR